MSASTGRKKTGFVIAWVMLLSAPALLTQCGKVPGANNLPSVPGVPDVGGACPANIADAAAIMNANFGLEGELEGKVKAALAAGANLQKIAVDVEGEVTTACSNLAKDLGATDEQLKPAEAGPGKGAEAACNVASKLIAETKAKAQGKVMVTAKPPQCAASMSAMADCAAKCDAKIKPGEAKVQCEGGKLSGKCEGKCEGECTVEGAAKCEGTCAANCTGECKADFSGKCDGTCNGKCDGKDSKGKCAGTCDGTCAGKASGTCGGECKGDCSAGCTMKAKAECNGTCSGGCSVEFKEPKCSGEVKPPEMSAECKANCDAEVKAKLECTPGHVAVKAEGSADAQAAAKLKAALEKNLPVLLKVSVGMKDKLGSLAGNVQASLEGVKGAVTGGGAAALKVGTCLAASIEAQAKASVSIKVSVQASASASASAKGST
ncbi:MAG TPA: hypothetical protein VFQ61_13415 [Polyangiaceae bacterium]|nr:hypothetical protein [Polyangiaceae bacterium]